MSKRPDEEEEKENEEGENTSPNGANIIFKDNAALTTPDLYYQPDDPKAVIFNAIFSSNRAWLINLLEQGTNPSTPAPNSLLPTKMARKTANLIQEGTKIVIENHNLVKSLKLAVQYPIIKHLPEKFLDILLIYGAKIDQQTKDTIFQNPGGEYKQAQNIIKFGKYLKAGNDKGDNILGKEEMVELFKEATQEETLWYLKTAIEYFKSVITKYKGDVDKVQNAVNSLNKVADTEKKLSPILSLKYMAAKVVSGKEEKSPEELLAANKISQEVKEYLDMVPTCPNKILIPKIFQDWVQGILKNDETSNILLTVNNSDMNLSGDNETPPEDNL